MADLEAIAQEFNGFVLQTDICVGCLERHINRPIVAVLHLPLEIENKYYDSWVFRQCSNTIDKETLTLNLLKILQGETCSRILLPD